MNLIFFVFISPYYFYITSVDLELHNLTFIDGITVLYAFSKAFLAHKDILFFTELIFFSHLNLKSKEKGLIRWNHRTF